MISGENFLVNLGIHIRQLRERKDLSQQNLADMCNFPKSTLARIERAEMNTSIKTLVKIANALEIEPKELLDFNVR